MYNKTPTYIYNFEFVYIINLKITLHFNQDMYTSIDFISQNSWMEKISLLLL